VVEDKPEDQDTDAIVDTDVSAPALWAHRRLSNLQLERSAASALGVDVPTGPWLPPDPVIAGFTHLGGGVPLTATFVDDLEVWARAVAAAVAHPTSPQPIPRSVALQAEELPWSEGLRSAVELQPFTVFWIVGGEVSTVIEVPADDVWSVHLGMMTRLRVNQPSSVLVEIDGAPVGEATFYGERVDQVPGEIDAVIELSQGEHVVTVVPDFSRATPLSARQPGLDYYQDPEPYLGLDAITLVGEGAEVPPAPAQDALACEGAAPESDACATVVIKRALQRLWRRPVADEEIMRLQAVFQTAQGDGLSWADSVGEALVAALLSPSFALHLEGPPDATAADGSALKPYVTANRLAFALWQSGPDDALLACAADGALDAADEGPCGLLPQARRLLADPRADVLVDEFALRWLGVHDVDDLWFINRQFPRYTPGLLRDEQRETAALFRELWTTDHDLRALLTADHTWATFRVADVYGLSADSQTEPSRVSLAGSGRAGILGHAGILTATAKGSDPTSVDRATWVLSNLLCRTLPKPPANVPPLPPGDGPITERFQAHVSDPACAVCHTGIDPFGLPLSRFDALGELRADGSGRAPTTLPDGTVIDSVEDFGAWLASQDEFTHCAVRRVLTWVTATNHTTGDDDLVAALTQSALDKGFSFRAILETVIADPVFTAPEESP
jgi:hypothetical protein